jgi:hypothetical protein
MGLQNTSSNTYLLQILNKSNHQQFAFCSQALATTIGAVVGPMMGGEDSCLFYIKV